MVNRKCTRHDGSSIWKFCQSGEVNPYLPDLHHRLLAFVLVTLSRALPWIRFLGPRTIPDEMIRASAIETAIVAASLWHLLNIWPWARWLCLLRRNGRSIPSLLLGWPENQSARWGIPLRCSEWGIGNNPLPR
jgi:hypothetical protein